jgi:peptidoglycan/xylan/chitin deacetylase (PgdA/CDA1 family)
MDARMTIGCHGYAHEWLNMLEATAQEEDIDRALVFLSTLGADTRDWMMCYPYGAHDDRLLALVASKGCRAGVTVRPGIARPRVDHPLLLPRLDTNDLPRQGDAEPSRWTLDVA